MSKIIEMCITSKSGDYMLNRQIIEVVANKGIINDRYFSDENKKDTQITIIESENIDYYNKISNRKVPYINFRRNIITKGIKLNQLVGKEILLGKVKVKVHRLCDPCKELQDLMKDKNFVKKFIDKGGLRCEILSNGNISTNDNIEVLNIDL